MRTILSMLAVLAVAFATAQSSRSSDDAAIRRVIADNSGAFNRRDPKALGANVTTDTDHIGVRGDWVSGKAALEKNLAEYFTSPDRPTTEDDVQQIRFIKPDVAVVIVKRLYRRPAETRQSMATYVLQRVGADWRIAAFQNTFIQ